MNDGSNLTLSGDVLSHNVAVGSATNDFNGGALGGALESESGSLDITSCTITGNQALGGASSFGDGFGGGIYVLAGSATITNSTISGTWPEELTTASTGPAPAAASSARPAFPSPAAPPGNRAIGENGGTGRIRR